MVKSFSRGHEIFWDGAYWRFIDTGAIDDGARPCKRCGKSPTPEGYDACLGHIPGVMSACCGHGVEQPYIVSIDATVIVGAPHKPDCVPDEAWRDIAELLGEEPDGMTVCDIGSENGGNDA